MGLIVPYSFRDEGVRRDSMSVVFRLSIPAILMKLGGAIFARRVFGKKKGRPGGVGQFRPYATVAFTRNWLTPRDPPFFSPKHPNILDILPKPRRLCRISGMLPHRHSAHRIHLQNSASITFERALNFPSLLFGPIFGIQQFPNKNYNAFSNVRNLCPRVSERAL